MTTFLGLALAALAGGIVATWLSAWLEHLRRFESSRLILLGELMGHHGIVLLLAKSPTTRVRYSYSAWLEHRDRLARRLQRNPDVWADLSTYYAVIESQPEPEELDEEVERRVGDAIANLSRVRLSVLETVPVYGWRKAWADWRDIP